MLWYTAPTGKRREMGLGPCHRGSLPQAGASVSAARDEAHKAREQLRQGIDPIDAREPRREAAKAAATAAQVDQQRQRWTLAKAARDYHERVIEPSRTAKHAATWIKSLENHLPSALWSAPVDSIEPPAILAALLDVKPHERARNVSGDTVPETVQRIRQRLDAVFEDAIFHRRATMSPAAAIRRKMREATPRRERGQFRTLAYGEASALMAKLRAAERVSARCLELAVLTAARTSEAVEAEWTEFDLIARTWVIPAAGMKAKEAHTVFLSPRALEIVQAMQGFDPVFVFPSPMPERAGNPMSNMALLATLDRLGYRDRTTVHGLARLRAAGRRGVLAPGRRRGHRRIGGPGARGELVPPDAAADGASALPQGVDLLLSDANLEDGTVDDVLQLLREMGPAGGGPPVVPCMSAYVDEAIRSRLLAASVAEMLAKDEDVAMFATRVLATAVAVRGERAWRR